MSEDKNGGQKSYDFSVNFSLMLELQQILYNIARTAELSDPEMIKDIHKESEVALRLIDSYLTTAKLNSGQTSLAISTVGVGSLLHETAYELRRISGVEVSVDVGSNHPVMGNSDLLKNFLFCIGHFISKSVAGEVKFCSYKTRDKSVGIGVVAKGLNINNEDLQKAMRRPLAHMAISSQSSQSAVMLLVADIIAQALGSKLMVKKHRLSRGFSLCLPQSEQLSLI